MDYTYNYSNEIGIDWVLQKIPGFLFPDLGKKRNRIKRSFSGVLVTHQQKPAALILGSSNKEQQTYRIHSLFVHPSHRNKGIATEMIKRIQQHAAADGVKKIEAYFRAHWTSRPALEQIFQKLGWAPPKGELVIVKGKSGNVLKLFMHDKRGLIPGYRIQDYGNLIAKERQLIDRKLSENREIPSYLNPFILENTIFAPASLFLFHQEHVVGWVISHLLRENLNEFTTLYLDKEHRNFKTAHLLMKEAIHRQHHAGVREFLITSKLDGNPMSRFLIRHAPRTGVQHTRSLYTSKLLS